MDLLAVLKIAWRRWYVLLPMVLVSIVASWFASQQVAPSYQLDGVMVVTTPYAETEEILAALQGNNFRDTEATAAIVESIGNSSDVRQVVEKSGGVSDYKILAKDQLVFVTVLAGSTQKALETYSLVENELNARLNELQAGYQIPPQARVTVSDVLQPRSAQLELGSRQKVLIASFALGIVLSFATCIFMDYLLQRRKVGTGDNAPYAMSGTKASGAGGPRDNRLLQTRPTQSTAARSAPHTSGGWDGHERVRPANGAARTNHGPATGIGVPDATHFRQQDGPM